MAGSMIWRQRIAAAAAVAVAALALAACAKDGQTDGANPTGDSQLGGAPTTAPTGGPSASPPGGGGGGGTTYPKDAKAYALEVLKAWAKPDYNRLSQLAVQAAVQQVKDSITFGGKPNAQWTNVNCRPAKATGFTSCLFRNAHGDEATIKLINTQLGFTAAVTEAQLNRTEYNNDPGSYVAAFMYAWQQGNTQRMARLSNTSIKNFFAGEGTPIAAYGQSTPAYIGGGYSKVEINGLSGDSGRYYTFSVLTDTNGKPNAINRVCKGSGCDTLAG